jgi:hypothetical protein
VVGLDGPEDHTGQRQKVYGTLRMSEVCGLSISGWNPGTGKLAVERQYRYGALTTTKTRIVRTPTVSRC